MASYTKINLNNKDLKNSPKISNLFSHLGEFFKCLTTGKIVLSNVVYDNKSAENVIALVKEIKSEIITASIDGQRFITNETYYIIIFNIDIDTELTVKVDSNNKITIIKEV